MNIKHMLLPLVIGTLSGCANSVTDSVIDPVTNWSKEPIAVVHKAATAGYADAQSALGGMYRFGKGVKQDYNQAFTWLQKSAVQGYADAQYKLGNMYATGTGVTKDYSQALAWYQKAAAQSYAKAESALG
ncbi:MAG: tetratricopeptide repeat protein, partial [Aeromonas sp.]